MVRSPITKHTVSNCYLLERIIKKRKIKPWKIHNTVQVYPHHPCFVSEPNNVMKSSYLILDEFSTKVPALRLGQSWISRGFAAGALG
jgi:hypothetical protein